MAASVPWQDLALIVAGILFLVLSRLVVYRRRRGEDDPRKRVPLMKMPTPHPAGQPAGSPRRPVFSPSGESSGSAPAWPPADVFDQQVADRSAPQFLPAVEAESGAEVQAGLVRFHRPPEGTLQLLPGRLDIVSGNERVDAIRFVKVPGKEAIVTFGRSPGEPHTHVELKSPTVSRKHAVMRFDDATWQITNLSTTNPLVVRGRQLTVNDSAVRLEDGDRVEMGEVVFQYHERQLVARAAEVVARPLMERPAKPVDRPLVRPPAEGVARPLMERPAKPVDRPLVQPPAEGVARPLVQPAADVVARSVVEPAAELVDRPLRKLSFDLVDRSGAEQTAEVADLPLMEYAAAVVDRTAELEDVDVDVAARSRGWANGAVRRAAPERVTPSRAHVLTAREIEIAQMVVDRKSNKAIGELLDISPRTVSTHLTNIFRKLDVASRGEMADYVRRHGTG